MTGSLFPFDRVADRVRLARGPHGRPSFVVEGKLDRRLLESVFEVDPSDVYIAGTRQRVLDAATDAQENSLSSVWCVVDRDFDDTVSFAEQTCENIIAYDNADLESMLWHSATLARVLDELASEAKLGEFGGVEALRECAARILLPLSRLRRANALHGWGINFDTVDLSRKIDTRTLIISPQALCDALWNSELDVAKDKIYSAASDASYDPSCPASGASLVRGRDALAVLSAALRKQIGNFSHQQAAVDRMEEVLRVAARRRDLRETSWLPRLESALTAEAS